jgi:hypothetical protein
MKSIVALGATPGSMGPTPGTVDVVVEVPIEEAPFVARGGAASDEQALSARAPNVTRLKVARALVEPAKVPAKVETRRLRESGTCEICGLLNWGLRDIFNTRF